MQAEAPRLNRLQFAFQLLRPVHEVHCGSAEERNPLVRPPIANLRAVPPNKTISADAIVRQPCAPFVLRRGLFRPVLGRYLRAKSLMLF